MGGVCVIPISNNTDIKIVEYNDKTYDISNPKVKISGKDALKQAIPLIIYIERYKHEIYSWNFGVEMVGLFGKSKDYIYAELETRIAEALCVDNRINSVYEFVFEFLQNMISVSFTVNSIYGEFESGVSLVV